MSLTLNLLLVSLGEFRARTQNTQTAKAGNQIHGHRVAGEHEKPHPVA
jgi:hypothetical protein